MPRLLSKKSPQKISEGRASARGNEALRTGSETLRYASSEVRVEEKSELKKESFKPKTEDEMTAWEYYNSLMVFGKRKMTRIEWVIWKNKKDYEDMRKGKFVYGDPPLRKKISFAEYNWRLKKDPHFVDTVAREEFSLDFKKNGAWC